MQPALLVRPLPRAGRGAPLGRVGVRKAYPEECDVAEGACEEVGRRVVPEIGIAIYACYKMCVFVCV